MKRLWLVLMLAACTSEANPDVQEERAATPQCSDARHVASLPASLQEASGVAASIRHPGILWVHNDSGEPVIFALDTLGNVRGRVRVPLPNGDWEDIEVANCAAGSCIYLGAIGDNRQNRGDRAILRFPEPDINDARAEVPVRFRYHLPSGPQDSEALFVLPDERMYLLTKGRSGPITLFAFPHPAANDGMNTLTEVQQLTTGLVQLPDMVTGAGATPDGKLIVIRSYSALQLYSFDNAKLQPLLPGTGFDVQNLHEFQGEGADITADGTVYLVSERGLSDEDPPLSRLSCTASR
jgi:hypothetical protein